MLSQGVALLFEVCFHLLAKADEGKVIGSG
jgi:hypothetical protein